MEVAGTYSDVLPFDCLQRGQCGRVCDLAGDSCQIQRLYEMGIQPGVIVQMLQPGSPCLVCIEGRRYSLRLDAGLEILVESAA